MSWPIVKLGDCLKLINGRAYSQHELLDSGTPVIRIQNLNGGDRWYYSNLELPEDKYCVKGDLLFAWSASFGPYVWWGEKSIFHYHIWRVIPFENLDKAYAYYLLDSITQNVRAASHGASMLHMTKTGMEDWKVLLPPLPEQKRIAAILDKADELKRKREAAIAKLDHLAQSIFVAMFGNVIVNDKGWQTFRLGDVGTLDRGISKHRPRNAPELLGGNYPLVQTGEVANCDGYIRNHNSSYSELGLRQSKMWPAGTLCITIAANIAKTGILTFDACFPDSVVGFRADNAATVEYVRVWLSFLQKMLEESAPESAQKNINLAILRELSIPFPPITLQEEFRNRLKAMQTLKVKFSSALAKQNNLFTSLQHQAFAGQL